MGYSLCNENKANRASLKDTCNHPHVDAGTEPSLHQKVPQQQTSAVRIVHEEREGHLTHANLPGRLYFWNAGEGFLNSSMLQIQSLPLRFVGLDLM